MTYIIADAGINWRDFNEADVLIRECAEARATAIKFQAYTTEPESTPRSQEINNIILTKEKIAYLYWRCKAHKIEFMCTPMYPDAVEMLNPYVKKWKVRFADRHNMEIQDRCKSTGKDILISTDDAFESNYPYKCLYCVPEYPPEKDGDGNCGEFWKLAPGVYPHKGFDGFSCHYPCIDIPINIWKSNPKLKYLEVHIKRDSYPDGYCPIDNDVSITISELAKLVKTIRC